MKKNNGLILATLAFLLTTFSSCQAIGDIFKAGVWVGVLIVVVIILIVVMVINKTKS